MSERKKAATRKKAAVVADSSEAATTPRKSPEATPSRADPNDYGPLPPDLIQLYFGMRQWSRHEAACVLVNRRPFEEKFFVTSTAIGGPPAIMYRLIKSAIDEKTIQDLTNQDGMKRVLAGEVVQLAIDSGMPVPAQLRSLATTAMAAKIERPLSVKERHSALLITRALLEMARGFDNHKPYQSAELIRRQLEDMDLAGGPSAGTIAKWIAQMNQAVEKEQCKR